VDLSLTARFDLSPPSPSGYRLTGMDDEIFDVVNEKDEVIGQLFRREVHRQGLLHRAVHILIYNQNGEIFLQKRSIKKDKFPGTWDSSAAGHLDTGEDYDACALREVREELGITLSCIPERIMRIAACEETGQEFVWVYRYEYDGPFVLNEDEIECGDWFPPAAVSRWMAERPGEFAPSLICIWRQLYPYGGQ
jgi:isopentenyldiphosphate isomerase